MNAKAKGFTFFPLPEEKFAVKPAEKLTDSLREELRARKVEVLRRDVRRT